MITKTIARKHLVDVLAKADKVRPAFLVFHAVVQVLRIPRDLREQIFQVLVEDRRVFSKPMLLACWISCMHSPLKT